MDLRWLGIATQPTAPFDSLGRGAKNPPSRFEVWEGRLYRELQAKLNAQQQN
jgi:hypothetical protein